MKTFQEPAATLCLQLSFAETLLERFQTMNLRVYPYINEYCFHLYINEERSMIYLLRDSINGLLQ